MTQNPLNHCEHHWAAAGTVVYEASGQRWGYDMKHGGDGVCMLCGATCIREAGKIIHYDRDGGKLPYGKSANTGD